MHCVDCVHFIACKCLSIEICTHIKLNEAEIFKKMGLHLQMVCIFHSHHSMITEHYRSLKSKQHTVSAIMFGAKIFFSELALYSTILYLHDRGKKFVNFSFVNTKIFYIGLSIHGKY